MRNSYHLKHHHLGQWVSCCYGTCWWKEYVEFSSSWILARSSNARDTARRIAEIWKDVIQLMMSTPSPVHPAENAQQTRCLEYKLGYFIASQPQKLSNPATGQTSWVLPPLVQASNLGETANHCLFPFQEFLSNSKLCPIEWWPEFKPSLISHQSVIDQVFRTFGPFLAQWQGQARISPAHKHRGNP